MTSIAKHFADLPDPRHPSYSSHPLVNLLTIALLAMICGGQGWDDMADFAEIKQEWLATFLDMSAGIPCADTFRRLFERLRPGPFRESFARWMEEVVVSTEGKLLNVDGKSNRRSFDRKTGSPALHVVRAWLAGNQVVLGQIATEAKSNEITAIPLLLKMLNIKGALVTMDAMGTQREIAEVILEQEADYVMALKDNQPTLFREAIAEMNEAVVCAGSTVSFTETHDRGHGRVEHRRMWTTTRLGRMEKAGGWPGLKCLGRIQSFRQEGDKVTEDVRWFLCSRVMTAEELGKSVRGHWGIENQCHWRLDVQFREDESRVRDRVSQENLSLLRSMSLNLLKVSKVGKRQRGIEAKRRMCGWDHGYLLGVVAGVFSHGLCACPACLPRLLFSEVRSRGSNGGTDEFVELFNPTDEPITFNKDWSFGVRAASKPSNCASTTLIERFNGASSGKVIPPRSTMLWVNPSGPDLKDYNDGVAEDGGFSTGFGDAGNLILSFQQTITDAICYYFDQESHDALVGCSTPYVCEGEPVSNLPHGNGKDTGNVDQSLVRAHGAAPGTLIDTDDNSKDFSMQPSSPRNLAAGPLP